ncbi:MAG: aminoglycoside phosphotransferase family protein [Cytophagales bacterium]|nr:aminoglycoside phosphotransferase family protein [Cytophagales bacterium]
MSATLVTHDLNAIASAFALQGRIISIEPFGSGHINDTYAVRTAEAGTPDYVLQRINHQIFPDVEGMMDNIQRVTRHIRQKLTDKKIKDADSRVITVIPTKDGKSFFRDEEGNFWRMLVLIANSKSFDQVQNTKQAFEGGKAFGEFQQQLADLPGGPLTEILPNFHNVLWRFDNFEKALKENPAGRAEETAEEIEFLKERIGEMRKIQDLLDDGAIPVRVTHNDTKFNNVLLDSKDQAMCVVDLDTVMSGCVHFDFGDSIRTTANTGAEDDPNLENISMSLELFEAYAKGFLSQTVSTLTDTEIRHLAFSAKLLTYIMGLRFLTDYIDGDNYYKISHPKHNLQRARAQFQLLKSMEQQFAQMEEIITDTVNSLKEKN